MGFNLMAKFHLNDRVREIATGRLGTIKQGEGQHHTPSSQIPYLKWDDQTYTFNYAYDVAAEGTLELVPTFKPGDKVRITKSDSCGVPIGTIATLTKHSGGTTWLMDCDVENEHSQRECDFELVIEEDKPKKPEPLKPGDRVMVVDGHRNNGQPTTITEVSNGVAYFINYDGKKDWYGCDAFEKIEDEPKKTALRSFMADWGSEIKVPNLTKPKKGTSIMSTVKEKIRKLRLSKDDLVLEEQGFMTAEGEYTEDYKQAVRDMLYEEYKPKVLAIAQELAEAEKAEAGSKK